MSKGKTVIIIAHRLATIEAADQILVVDDGRIANDGEIVIDIRKCGMYNNHRCNMKMKTNFILQK